MIQDSDNELGDHKASEAKTSASKSTTTPINQHGLIENKTPKLKTNLNNEKGNLRIQLKFEELINKTRKVLDDLGNAEPLTYLLEV
ncbi:uncharacterized protein OCT59_001534 [Rhizophagus irregularis]|uniref:uncharacterized protein n=1 Tax=Rhizophagus irregularis TaxID=588596 RepID=UPI003331885C|nr:hypothetical protein OCT59_001534 [Rhizophagus irregularis]